MFKRIAQKLKPNNPKPLEKIKIEYGEILAQSDCESLLFFMQPSLKWGGSLNATILEKAGPELDTYILDHCTKPKNGQVFPLPPFSTNYKALFMAILPNWDGGNGFEERDLLNCYRGTLDLMAAAKIKSIAIPALGRDKRDFPHIRFARLALQGILEKTTPDIDWVKIVCVDKRMMETYLGQIEKLKK